MKNINKKRFKYQLGKLVDKSEWSSLDRKIIKAFIDSNLDIIIELAAKYSNNEKN